MLLVILGGRVGFKSRLQLYDVTKTSLLDNASFLYQ